MTLGFSAHADSFARSRLPPRELWPELRFDLPELQYPERFNCATMLLDDALSEGHGPRIAIRAPTGVWSYQTLLDNSNRIANVLVNDMRVLPGNRVLLRAVNCPALAAAWLAVMKVGAIAVTTVPLLREKELSAILKHARIQHGLCHVNLCEELNAAARSTGLAEHVVTFGDGDLESRMGRQPPFFGNVETAADDVCLLAYTSGTTGEPKATMHFHRDLIAIADIVGRHMLQSSPDDIYTGTPPLGFTFGLGGLLVIPLRFRGSTVLGSQSGPQGLLDTVQKFRSTCLFTSPTMYRNLMQVADQFDLSSLSRCVSAGEPLTLATSDAWWAVTGKRLIDGIGSTEMTHIFVGSKAGSVRPGATGKPLPGYQACVLDDQGKPLPNGHSGLLAVKGPTGCRYLDDVSRQREYVRDGWNITGDRYRVDADGFFWFEARVDDMIISSGYNIAGPEVEAALLQHPAVDECAVVGSPDEVRGQIVKAFVVTAAGVSIGPELVRALQEHVQSLIAPYKYPRAIEFVTSLPRTATGKVQRNLLRQREWRATVVGTDSGQA